jgi:hypothetical protein
MIRKFVVVGTDDVPKDLPHNAKFRTRFVSEQGMNFGKDSKFRWIKQKYYKVDFIYKSGSFKKGSNYNSKGEFTCYTFFSKRKALEHIEYYRNNPRHTKNILKKLFIVETYGFFDVFLILMATRCVLKNKFNYKNIYDGFPFAINIYSFGKNK